MKNGAERASIDFTALLQETIENQRVANIDKLKAQKAQEKDIQAQKQKAQKEITWYVTPQQLDLMNNRDRTAIDEFFEDNQLRILRLARYMLRKLRCVENWEHKKMVEADDLINQAYVDIRDGKVFFDYNQKSITRAVIRSMRYAPVGGAPDGIVFRHKPALKLGRV